MLIIIIVKVFVNMTWCFVLQVKDGKAHLTITAAERGDTGPYKLKLRNPEGTAEGSFNVTVECECYCQIE